MSTEVAWELYASRESGAEGYEPEKWYVSDGNLRLNYYTSSYTDAFARVSSNGYAYANADGLDKLYPNATAHPTKATVEMRIRCYSVLGSTRWAVRFGGTEIYHESRSSTSYATYTSGALTSSSITSSYKGSSRIDVYGSSGNGGLRLLRITLYFMQYGFSASAGTGIVSATVDKPNGYDGDTVTFTASVQSGYIFDGWYNGSTKVSGSPTYQHTVSGADLPLTAIAVPPPKTVTTKYNGTTIATESRMPPVAVSYNGAQIANVDAGGAKILFCKGKIMLGDVVVGNKKFLCNGKVMADDLCVLVGSPNILDGKTWGLSNVTLADGVFSFATEVLAMAQITLPKPIANHLYYGRVEERRMPECTSVADGRFEYYAGDGTNKNMIYSYIVNTPNDGQWHKFSQILSMDAPIDGNWVMRNFTVSANGACYRRNPLLVDLTATFGAGEEPDLAWCDANLVEGGLTRLLNLNRTLSTSVTTNPDYAVSNFNRERGSTDGTVQNIAYTENSLTFREGCIAACGTCFPLNLTVGKTYRLSWTAAGDADTARVYVTGYANGAYNSTLFGTSASVINAIGNQHYDFTVPSGTTTVCITFGAKTGTMVSYTGVELIEL